MRSAVAGQSVAEQPPRLQGAAFGKGPLSQGTTVMMLMMPAMMMVMLMTTNTVVLQLLVLSMCLPYTCQGTSAITTITRMAIDDFTVLYCSLTPSTAQHSGWYYYHDDDY